MPPVDLVEHMSDQGEHGWFRLGDEPNVGGWKPVYRYIVTVSGCSAEQADKIMAERLGPDEDYGFAYTLDYEAMQ